jgi:adenylate cyclase
MKRLLGRLLPWSGATVLGAYLAIAFAAVALWREARGRPVPFVDAVEEAILSWKFQVRGQVRPGDDVVIAAIDERSVQRFGRWPWRRDAFALLVERLRSYGVRTVAFDVVFDEPDPPRGRREARDLLASLGRGRPRRDPSLEWLARMAVHDPDARFAESVRSAGNVVLGYFLFRSAGDAPGMSPEDLTAGLSLVAESAARIVRAEAEVGLQRVAGARPPIERLARAAGKWMGYFNARSEAEGGGFHLAHAVDGALLLHLSLVAAAHFRGFDPTVVLGRDGLPRISLEETLIPTETHGRFYANHYGPRNTFKHFSVADIVDGNVPPERLRGKLVFVGATAIALFDKWRTPFDADLAGVEIHATAADNILTRRFLARPPELTAVEVALLLLLGPLLGAAVSRARLVVGLALALLLLVATGAADYLLFREGLLAHSALSYMEIAVVALASYVLLYFRVFKERKRLRNTMRHYLAPSVLEEILRDQSKLKLGGEKRELTVLFSDIRGFTSLSEALDAGDLAAFLNEYFTPMTDVVLRHLGTFDKYMGDALMAFFGAPKEMADHAARACRAALEMRAQLGLLNEGWQARGLPVIEIGVGLNTGPAVFGNMGSDRLFNYTVVGDHVNLASRLEGACKLFGASILVSDSTARAAGESFLFRRLGRVHVPGKGEPIEVFELLGPRGDEPALRLWLGAFARGVERFEARDLGGAEEGFREARSLRADPVAEAYLARVSEVCGSRDWDPAWRSGK